MPSQAFKGKVISRNEETNKEVGCPLKFAFHVDDNFFWYNHVLWNVVDIFLL